MLKITSAPTAPIPVHKQFSVTGATDPIFAGKQLILFLDNQLKIMGPPVMPKGFWRVDLCFEQPGNHRLVIALNTERVELGIQVVGNPMPGVPPLHLNQNPASGKMPTLEQLVRQAYERGFSDIHLGVGKVPRFRNRGQIEVGKYPITDEATFENWLREVLTEEDIRRFKDTLDFDGAAQYPFARVRLNVFGSLKGPAMVLRLIPLKIRTLEELNLPANVFKDICHYQKGLVLITGPTGSGKSTTLAAMIDYINHEMPKHIITIEDPIEFVHESRKSLINQREVGIHTHEYERALVAALREDPDIILIGEMRDRSTVNIALKAAQTGHLVFGTLHTNSAVKTIERILNLYNPDEQEPMRIQIAESLVAVIAQSLVRTTDNKRAPIHEIMLNTEAIKDFIKRGEVEEIEAMIPKSDYYGMSSMTQSIYQLYLAGQIDEETAFEAAPKPNELRIMIASGMS